VEGVGPGVVEHLCAISVCTPIMHEYTIRICGIASVQFGLKVVDPYTCCFF
jgi:hypothetical protein